MKFSLSSLTILLFLISSIYLVSGQSCVSTIPLRKDDCITQSTSTQICCYQVSSFGANKSCVLVDNNLDNYSPLSTVNGNDVYTDCGAIGAYGSNTGSELSPLNTTNTNDLVINGRVCGSMNPTSASDCNSYSVYLNSCCYYESQGNTGCYWLGKTYFGIATFSGYTVVCAGEMLRTYGLVLISFLALFLI